MVRIGGERIVSGIWFANKKSKRPDGDWLESFHRPAAFDLTNDFVGRVPHYFSNISNTGYMVEESEEMNTILFGEMIKKASSCKPNVVCSAPPSPVEPFSTTYQPDTD